MRGAGPAVRPAVTVRCIQIPRFGGPEVLRLIEAPSPPLVPGAVRIEVTASGVNFADVMMRLGLYPEAPKPPFVPGYEIAGVVTEVGPGTAGFAAGDRVLAACRFGGYASEVVLPALQCRMIPAHLSDAEAAAVPVAFLTAWVALEEMARAREGDSVLIQGAAGGVGTAAVQIAARRGAEVTGLVGSEAKRDAVLALGAREVFTYGEWDAPAADRAGRTGRRFNVILESRGGSRVKQAYKLLSVGGRLVTFGVSAMVTGSRRSIPRVLGELLRTPRFNPIGLAMSNAGVFGLNMLSLFDTERGLSLLMRAMDAVLEGFERGAFKVLVGKKFPLREAGAAHAFLTGRSNVGKIVLTEQRA
jgi:NADPH:quinone reductase-like Zn-dependent oxidoreductase